MSFTRKISQKNNVELTTKADTAFLPDGVYILHETLGIKTVEGWNKKLNKDVVGILVVEDDHKIVVALEDSLKNLPVYWSSTELSAAYARFLTLFDGYLGNGCNKVSGSGKVRPVSKFNLCYVIYKKNKSEEQ